MKNKSFVMSIFCAIVNVFFLVAAFITVHFIEPFKPKKRPVVNTIKKVSNVTLNAKAWLYAFMARWHEDSCSLLNAF